MPVQPANKVFNGSELFAPAGAAAVVVPSDVTTNDATARPCTGIYVGVAGNVAVQMAGNDTGSVVFPAVPAGAILPVRAVRVYATGTTATSMVFMYGVK
jgi:hypothetical protein